MLFSIIILIDHCLWKTEKNQKIKRLSLVNMFSLETIECMINWYCRWGKITTNDNGHNNENWIRTEFSYRAVNYCYIEDASKLTVRVLWNLSILYMINKFIIYNNIVPEVTRDTLSVVFEWNISILHCKIITKKKLWWDSTISEQKFRLFSAFLKYDTRKSSCF